MTAESDEVLIRVDGGVGLVTLNRPKAINSLNHNMVTVIDRALSEWAQRRRGAAVVLAGAGERGLCAGGDVVADLQQRPRRRRRGPQLLVRRVPAQRADRPLPQAVRRR